MSPSIVLAGGGTGGHVFPLVAVAEALRVAAPHCQVTFVGTERGMEAKAVPALGFRLELLDVRPIRGIGLRGALRGANSALQVMPAAFRLLDELKPQVVLSVGGYAAGPITLAAWLRGIHTALLEPNSAMGLANLCVASIVDRAYVAFEEVETHLSPSRIRRTGVPLRPGFCPKAPRVQRDRLNLLVLGGSQGAASINSVVPEVVRKLGDSIEIMHQCGSAHIDQVRKAYGDADPHRINVVPFIDDMPDALAWSDLVISRSGASAVSEISAVGRPSILIPFPFAAGDHQLKNARALERAGAAVCIESAGATPERLHQVLVELRDDPARLSEMAQCAARWGRPDAARAIASDLIEWSEPSLAAARLPQPLRFYPMEK